MKARDLQREAANNERGQFGNKVPEVEGILVLQRTDCTIQTIVKRPFVSFRGQGKIRE